jgi:phosphoglycolate phosphatase-like HAD superfamily hydrolase
LFEEEEEQKEENELRLRNQQVMFVGDFRDDLACGRKAGNVTCLLNNATNYIFSHMADLNIRQLDELIKHLSEGFHVERDDEIQD